MEVTLEVQGGVEALKALRVLEPTVAREVGRDMTNVGKRIAAAMSDTTPDVPASGWVGTSGARGSRGGAGWPAWEPLSYKVTRRELTVRVTGRSSNPAIAAMFETMGRNTRVQTPQGRQLIKNMNRRGGEVAKSGRKSGRARRVAGEQYPDAIRDMQAAVDRSIVEVNRRMP